MEFVKLAAGVVGIDQECLQEGAGLFKLSVRTNRTGLLWKWVGLIKLSANVGWNVQTFCKSKED